MNVRVLGYSASDWLNAALLMLAEGALAWLAINLLLGPARNGNGSMAPATIAMLFIAATVVPRLCHDRGIWGAAFSIVVTGAIVITTGLAVLWTSFPDSATFDPEWIDQATASLIRQPNNEEAPIWIVILSSGAIWWRGVLRGRPDIDAGLTLLRAGSVILVALVIAHSILEDGFGDQQLTAAVLAFYSGVLLAIAMMRQELVPWRVPTRWFETVLLPVLLIIVPATLVIGLLTRDLSEVVELLLDPIILVLTLFLRILSIVLVVIAMVILVPIVWLVSKLPVAQPGDPNISPFQLSRQTVERAGESASSLPDPFRYLMAALLLMLVFAGIARFRLRLGFMRTDGPDQTESIRIEGSLLGDLRRWFGDLLAGRRLDQEDDQLARLRGEDRWRYTVSVRERYAEFLRWSSQQGHPRSTSMTPDELQERWTADLVADRDAAILRLTALYDRARYGNAPMTSGDVVSMEEAWSVIAQDRNTAL